MNNEYFRKLVQNTPARQDGDNSSPRPSASSTLGSKRSSFVPMTPRTVRGGSGNDFARQLAERNAAAQGAKKFRSAAAPKGSRLAQGFTDRTAERFDEETDEKGARIKALEEQVKLGRMDQATFEALRDQITGGDIGATHLVKGLDRRLLERIRKGEDVMGTGQTKEEDFDEELDRLEEKEVGPIERERVVKKGEMAAPPPPVAGAKRSRDQILAELKAQRKAQAEARLAARPELGSRFRDVGAAPRAGAGPRIERDDKGREVLITVDEHGNVKKKVRKVQPGAQEATNEKVPAKVKFLDEGITLPAPKPVEKPAEEDKEDSDDDIFENAGTSYDPLGDIGSDDSDGEDKDNTAAPPTDDTKQSDQSPKESESPSPEAEEKPSMAPPPLPSQSSTSSAPRNYFASTSTSEPPEDQTPQNPFNDAAFLAAIKKAGALSSISLSLSDQTKDPDATEDAEAKEARLRRRAQMLAASDRDLEDMDMGFGSSRFGDEEEGEDGGKVKLSQWKGTVGDDDDEAEVGGGKKKRSKKRKGDKNSAKDVLGVLERRKEGK